MKLYARHKTTQTSKFMHLPFKNKNPQKMIAVPSYIKRFLKKIKIYDLLTKQLSRVKHLISRI